MSKKEELKRQILQLTREYYNEVHKTSKVLTRHSISGSLPVLGPISSKPVWQNGWG